MKKIKTSINAQRSYCDVSSNIGTVRQLVSKWKWIFANPRTLETHCAPIYTKCQRNQSICVVWLSYG